MIYTAIDTFYLTDEQLQDTPSRKDGIDEATETTLRIYGCDLIQESGILLKVPQQVMATGQVLFHRFYCKKSFVRFNVKRVAASCVWLASKLEENPRRARHVLNVFHRMECRRENLPIEHLDAFSKKYSELKMDLIRSERHLLKEMGFICHVEHPHKFISNYLATLETPPELRQEAWNLANDSLRTTLCVRFKSAVVACGVVYAAARRFHVPLPEDPPWWKAFDAEKTGIDEEGPSSGPPMPEDANTSKVSPAAVIPDFAVIKAAIGKLKDSTKSDDNVPVEGEVKEEAISKSKGEHRTDTSGEQSRDRERDKERERHKGRERERGRDSERERERDDAERDREKVKDRSHRSKDRGKDSGHAEKAKHHSSRDRDYHGSSYSSREKDRHRHHSYG
ncbi:Cyclin C/H/T/L [Cynara cardunculus var. scolymus]|uniref:Cyclin-L1-1 n=1 Tax=Cynara cardunculus var. scolymus TaxID=59895 RepID=A0A103YD28_CYNCS|nr:Cyclin C/H/T/L [Cynara cardunculus var. scolymus]